MSPRPSCHLLVLLISQGARAAEAGAAEAAAEPLSTGAGSADGMWDRPYLRVRLLMGTGAARGSHSMRDLLMGAGAADGMCDRPFAGAAGTLPRFVAAGAAREDTDT